MTSALQEVDGVFYPADLPPAAVEAFQAARAEGCRVRVRYGRDYHSNAGYPEVDPDRVASLRTGPAGHHYHAPIGGSITHIETTRAPIRTLWERG